MVAPPPGTPSCRLWSSRQRCSSRRRRSSTFSPEEVVHLGGGCFANDSGLAGDGLPTSPGVDQTLIVVVPPAVVIVPPMVVGAGGDSTRNNEGMAHFPETDYAAVAPSRRRRCSSCPSRQSPNSGWWSRRRWWSSCRWCSSIDGGRPDGGGGAAVDGRAARGGRATSSGRSPSSCRRWSRMINDATANNVPPTRRVWILSLVLRPDERAQTGAIR